MALPLPFTKLNSAISIFTPPTTPSPISPPPSSESSKDPTTILILQWMGASPRSRALASVYAKYNVLFPSARLITVVSRPEWFVSTSNATRQALIKPVVSAILSDPAPETKTLIHLFSNGGALTYVDICTLFKQQKESLEVKGIILDSAPGQPGLTEAWEALRISFPKGLLYYPIASIAALAIGLAWSCKSAFGLASMVDKTYVSLNDLILTDGKAGRLYVYSEADRLVGSGDVERHIKQAKEKGVRVWELKEQGTPHVQHLLLGGARYWEKVEDFWRVVGRGGEE